MFSSDEVNDNTRSVADDLRCWQSGDLYYIIMMSLLLPCYPVGFVDGGESWRAAATRGDVTHVSQLSYSIRINHRHHS